jgi:hypothetical protein
LESKEINGIPWNPRKYTIIIGIQENPWNPRKYTIILGIQGNPWNPMNYRNPRISKDNP